MPRPVGEVTDLKTVRTADMREAVWPYSQNGTVPQVVASMAQDIDPFFAALAREQQVFLVEGTDPPVVDVREAAQGLAILSQ